MWPTTLVVSYSEAAVGVKPRMGELMFMPLPSLAEAPLGLAI
jgi:hypothetical protein